MQEREMCQIVGLSVVVGMLLSAPLMAAGNYNPITVDGGKVNFSGAITTSACAVDTGSDGQIVQMGQVKSNRFNALGEYSDPVSFNIQLNDCDTSVSNQVGIIFQGVSDGKDPLVLSAGSGLNAATGIGIGIFDALGQLQPLNTQPRNYSALQNGQTILHFIARYKSTSRSVTAGNANAQAWFTLEYQ
jgi:fimbrial protein